MGYVTTPAELEADKLAQAVLTWAKLAAALERRGGELTELAARLREVE